MFAFLGRRCFHYLPSSLGPLRTIYATRKHSSPSQLLCYVLQPALHVFQLHTFLIQAKLILILCFNFRVLNLQKKDKKSRPLFCYSFDNTDSRMLQLLPAQSETSTIII